MRRAGRAILDRLTLLLKAEDGSTAVEYAILGATVSAAIFTSLVLFGRMTERELQSIVSQQLSSPTTGTASTGGGAGTGDTAGSGGNGEHTGGNGGPVVTMPNTP